MGSITILPHCMPHPRQVTPLTTKKQMMQEPIYLVLYHPPRADIVMCLALSALYTVHCTLDSTLYSTVYMVECIEQYTGYSLQCTMYSVQCTMHSVQCTVYSVQCKVYSVQFTVYISHPGPQYLHN